MCCDVLGDSTLEDVRAVEVLIVVGKSIWRLDALGSEEDAKEMASLFSCEL